MLYPVELRKLDRLGRIRHVVKKCNYLMGPAPAMSLYNAIFGVNPYTGGLLAILGIEASAVPRFRDCYVDGEGRIVIYARTGGANRWAS